MDRVLDSIEDPHHCDVDPDLAFHLIRIRSPNPNFHLNSDPYPPPHQSAANQKSNEFELFMQFLQFYKIFLLDARFESMHAFMKDTSAYKYTISHPSRY